MTIEFQCDGCQKTLRTADDKAGRTAHCPQCGASVTVPESTPGGFEEFESPPESHFSEFERLTQAPPRRRLEPVEVTCPMCGEVNDGRTDRCLACGEPLDAVVAPSGRLSLAFGDVWNVAWETWSANMGINIGAMAIAGLILLSGYLLILAIFFAGGMSLVMAGNQAEMSPAVAIGILVAAAMAYLFVFGIAMLLQVGLSRFGLDNVRTQNPSLGSIFDFSGRWVSSLVCMVVYGIALLVITSPTLVMMFAGSIMMEVRNEPNQSVWGLALYFAGLFGQYAMAALATMLLWPIPYMLADRRTDRYGSLIDGPRLAFQHWKLSALLALTHIGLLFIGSMACGIGLLFTYSMGYVLFAVAYDRCRLVMNTAAGEHLA